MKEYKWEDVSTKLFWNKELTKKEKWEIPQVNGEMALMATFHKMWDNSNMMLTTFGEVKAIEWGSARSEKFP